LTEARDCLLFIANRPIERSQVRNWTVVACKKKKKKKVEEEEEKKKKKKEEE
jgi:hypothetical protein